MVLSTTFSWLICLLAWPPSETAVHAARLPGERHPRIEHGLLPPAFSPEHAPQTTSRDLGTKTFTLRHIFHHGAERFPHLHRYIDISKHEKLKVTSDYGYSFEEAPRTLDVRVASMGIQRLAKRRPSDIDDLLAYSDYYGRTAELPADSWTIDDVAGPNITDKATIISFAKMAANAYVQSRDSSEWLPVGGGFNYTDDFGWEADGLRGHVFADEKNHTVVIGLKGTSPAIWDGADTTGNDKLNDNLFGSCCCGQGGVITWKQVCKCMTTTYTCNSTCLVKSLREKSHYYRSVRELYHNVTEKYPTSEVWLAGHSLGGVVSSLLGLTYGLPTLTYEAFPDALAASRLGLPTPPGYRIGSQQSRFGTGIYHFGHTADPIYMGTCNGGTSFCSIAGYAFQGLCHTGKTCIYDTVGDLGWRPGIGTHKIINVIKDVLEKYDHVPDCDEDVDCQDCYNWKFFESNGTETTTTSTSGATATTTHTKTVTCTTRGWFGCLDETTTTTATETATTTSLSSSSTTTSRSTSTCSTPGWFGCKDETSSTEATMTTITTTTRSDSTAPHSTTCATPGWLGCKDAVPSTTVHLPSTTAPPSAPTSLQTTRRTATPIATRTIPGQCISRAWYGLCRDRAEVNKHDL